MESAERAGDYLARNVHENGKMVDSYNPTTHSETTGDGLTRHAGTIYGMAVLFQEYHNETLKLSMKRALDFLMSFVHDCPLPYEPSRSQKCVWDSAKVRLLVPWEHRLVNSVDTDLWLTPSSFAFT
jgi:hypothetical protein